MEKEINPNQILRKREVLGLLKISDPTLWRMEHAGSFPRRVQLGGNSVGWIFSEVNAWLEARKAARSAAQ